MVSVVNDEMTMKSNNNSWMSTDEQLRQDLLISVESFRKGHGRPHKVMRLPACLLGGVETSVKKGRLITLYYYNFLVCGLIFIILHHISPPE